ncbi:hypothetical protein PTSG_11168 [Salpingoeca rosetta]|uniref:Phosphatidate cytidylyltransferase, mitochondrial n=1 Tax=Salpingoeca rosetta (strain ATCC 50818 / BSB-021) TaxID=946362 RepID=F2USM1_SALR5|nr:uncharacterized protein PTSG_11168 [Salpingoeca rosetta]EGD81130.1 hypothetical protein PTSG_11168 [Salpingoeca rosetta]|eukprot:XP_004987815.1 hypothetical protein PTSG_11168 [Salpingoeca rosetta]
MTMTMTMRVLLRTRQCRWVSDAVHCGRRRGGGGGAAAAAATEARAPAVCSLVQRRRLSSANLDDVILPHLPKVAFAFAYGSSAFRQHDHIYTKNTMLDVIVAVDDAEAFHRENMQRNPHHYPYYARALGASAVASIQSKTGASIYYHPFVTFGDQLAKYGVITVADMERDLQMWDTLYVSGRLHKPVAMLTPVPTYQLQQALIHNLRFAVLTACCLLPPQFNEFELYHTIASLSYTGDVRMALAERKGKAFNIVKGNFDNFRALYAAALAELNCTLLSATGEYSLLQNPLSGLPSPQIVNRLPLTLQQHLDTTKPLEPQIRPALKRIISRSSLTQSLKGLFSAGISRSLLYLGEKLKKAWSK